MSQKHQGSLIGKLFARVPNYLRVAAKSKIDVAMDIERLMSDKKLTRSKFAEEIGSSPAYVTKVLSGDANFTIDSLAKFADALDAELSVRIEQKQAHSEHFSASKLISIFEQDNVIRVGAFDPEPAYDSPLKAVNESDASEEVMYEYDFA